jgi:hypothetical protein
MTGEVIQFVGHRALNRGDVYRQQGVPRGAAPESRRSTGIVEFRVARITRLVTELEELTRLSASIPSATLTEARAGLEKARRIVRPWTAADRHPRGDDLEGAPQPELDNECIERMYRELNRDM